MKLVFDERYDFKPVAIPTTKFEERALAHFKYDIMDEYGQVDFSILSYNEDYDEAIHFLKLWYKLPVATDDEMDGIVLDGEDFYIRMDGKEYKARTPSNLEVLAVAYKMAKRYRKLAMLRKKYANRWWVEELG